MDKGFKYRGFISYSQADKVWARRLHSWLETYRVPAGVVAGVGGTTRLGRFFRDDEEMSAAADIAVIVRQAIEESESLIVLCSPRSAKSKWVNAEVQQFRKTGRADKVFAVIIDGVPNSGDPATECFPPALRASGDPDDPDALPIEPLGLDIRKEGRERACARLAAGLLGVDFDNLWNRDRRRAAFRQRLTIGALAAATTVFAILAVTAVNFGFEAERQRQQALEAQSRALTEAASQRLSNRDVSGAQAIILPVLNQAGISESRSAAAINVFQEARAADSQLAVLSGHDANVMSAAYSPDGRRIVTASWDKTARIWDAATGKQLVVLSGDRTSVLYAAFSPDGRRIVTASTDGLARIWDAGTGKQLIVLSGNGRPLRAAAFSPDGRRIVTASHDKTARIWDADTGKQLVVLAGHDNVVYSAAFSPDGRHIVTASGDKTARIWDADTGKQLAVLSGHDDYVYSAVFSPDGLRIATASVDKTARIWDVGTGKQLAVLSGHDRFVTSAAFSRDGRRIVTGSMDGTVRLWDAATGRQLGALSGGGSSFTSAAFSPDGLRIVTASIDKTARIWDASPGKQLTVLSGHGSLVLSAAWSPDGRRIATASVDQTARIWDAATGAQIAVLRGHNGVVDGVAFSPDGQRIVTASFDATARIWDAANGKQLAVLSSPRNTFKSAAFSPDGRRIVTAHMDKAARIWDTATGKQLAVLRGHDDIVTSAAFSPDGRRVVTGSYDKTARIWDAATGTQIAVLSGHTISVNGVAYSPDGHRIVTASDDKTARIWDAATGRQLAVLSGHENTVVSAAWSPDGRRIVTASDDRTARIWDVTTATQLAVLSGHGDSVLSAAWSPDGRRIVTASDDQTARIWDAAIPADLDGQIAWSQAAQTNALTSIEQSRLGLPPDPRIRTWPDTGSECDSAAASIHDPDRQAPGVVQGEIVGDLAKPACTREIAKSGNTPRLAYQLGRVLLAKHDSKGARRAFETAVSGGYRAAQIDLANLLADPSSGMFDPARAVSLYEKAWADGVPVAAFELGQIYEHGARGAGASVHIALHPDISKAWSWYQKGADIGEPNALARFGEREDANAVAQNWPAKRDALLLDAFRTYAAAAERAQDEDWPDDAWKAWRYRRATLARLLARDGMMQQVADAYTQVHAKWQPHQPTWFESVLASLGL